MFGFSQRDPVTVAARGGHIVARAPNHLGDGVMARPAMRALAHIAGQLTIMAPGWGEHVYAGLGATIAPRGPVRVGDVAVLFAPSVRAAWESRRVRHRVGTPTDSRRLLLTLPVQPAVHRSMTYARIVEAVGGQVSGSPSLSVQGGVGPGTPMGHIGLNPVSVSGAVVQWSGFSDLAQALGRPVVVYGGPDEQRAALDAVPSAEHRVGLSLPDFARALERCAVFVSNDSGAAHFARACGVPTVVVHGSTTSARTGAAGALPVEGPQLACRPCYRKYCPTQVECLDIPVDRVLRAVQQLLEGASV